MTVQAFTGQARCSKQNITTLNDLLKYTPNVTLGTNGPGQGDIFMRGLSAGFRGSQSSADHRQLPERRDLPRRPVDAVPGPQRRHLRGRHGSDRGARGPAGHAVRRRRRGGRRALHHQQAQPRPVRGSTSRRASASPTAAGPTPTPPRSSTCRSSRTSSRFARWSTTTTQGGYIDNVPSTFNRSNNDLGNYYFNIKPGRRTLPQRPAGRAQAAFCALPNSRARSTTSGSPGATPTRSTTRARGLGALPDHSRLGRPDHRERPGSRRPTACRPSTRSGSNFQPLGAAPGHPVRAGLREGRLGKHRLDRQRQGRRPAADLHRRLHRSAHQGADGLHQLLPHRRRHVLRVHGRLDRLWSGRQPGEMFLAAGFWDDNVHNTHLSNEFRLSSPDSWRFRFIVGAFEEQFRIYDVMNFNYKTIPACSPANLTIALRPGGQPASPTSRTAPGSTANDPGIRGDMTAFGEDIQRGYDQTAFFGSVDFDIIPDKLTITAWNALVRLQRVRGRLPVRDGHRLPRRAERRLRQRHRQHQLAPRQRDLQRVQEPREPHLAGSPRTRWSTRCSRRASVRAASTARTARTCSRTRPGRTSSWKPNGYAPDNLNNYEVGLKAQLFDHRLLLNVSAYYMQWQHVQFYLFDPPCSASTPPSASTGRAMTSKAWRSRRWRGRPSNLTLQGSVSYNDSTQSVRRA